MITCPQCGKNNPENFNYCLDCGADLHPASPHSAESQFFIDLSSNSPDIKGARAEAGKGDTPPPAPGSDERKFVIPGEGETKPPGLPPDDSEEDVLELSPDDLIEEDMDAEGLQPVMLSAKDAADLLDAEETQKDEAEEKMAQCQKCGAKLDPGAGFCSKCGSPIGAAPDEGKTMFMHVGASTEESVKPVAKLVLLEPDGREGRTINLLDGESVCGRNGGDVVLDDPFVSPAHCIFAHEDGQMTVADTGSKNGVFLRISGEIILPSKTFFRIGHQLMQYIALADYEILPETVPKDDTHFLASPLGPLWGKLLRVGNEGVILENIPLRKPTFHIGREVGEITFPDDGFVSGNHANISNRDGQCILADLGSSNGTYVRIGQYALESNDYLLIGQRLMRFEYMT